MSKMSPEEEESVQAEFAQLEADCRREVSSFAIDLNNHYQYSVSRVSSYSFLVCGRH